LRGVKECPCKVIACLFAEGERRCREVKWIYRGGACLYIYAKIKEERKQGKLSEPMREGKGKGKRKREKGKMKREIVMYTVDTHIK